MQWDMWNNGYLKKITCTNLVPFLVAGRQDGRTPKVFKPIGGQGRGTAKLRMLCFHSESFQPRMVTENQALAVLSHPYWKRAPLTEI